MSTVESSGPAEPVSPRRVAGYRPAIVLIVTMAALATGVGLKYSAREQQVASMAVEQVIEENPGFAIPR